MAQETEAVDVRTVIERTEAEREENIPPSFEPPLEVTSPAMVAELPPTPPQTLYNVRRKVILSIGGIFIIFTFVPVASVYSYAATWVILTIKQWAQWIAIAAGVINLGGKATIYANFVGPTTGVVVSFLSAIDGPSLIAADYYRIAAYLGIGTPSTAVFSMLQLETLITFNTTVTQYAPILNSAFFDLADVAMDVAFQACTTLAVGALNFFGGYFVVENALRLLKEFWREIPHVLGRGTPADGEDPAVYLARRKKLLLKWIPGLVFQVFATPGMYSYIELTHKLYATFILPAVVAWLGYFPLGAWQFLFMVLGVAVVTAMKAGLSVGTFLWEFLQPNYKWPSRVRVGVNVFEVSLTVFLAIVSAWQLVYQAQLAGQGETEQVLSFITSFFIELGPFMYVIGAVDDGITWVIDKIAANCCLAPPAKVMLVPDNGNDSTDDSELTAASPSIQSPDEEEGRPPSRAPSTDLLLDSESPIRPGSPSQQNMPLPQQSSSWWSFFGCCKGNRGKIPKPKNSDEVFTNVVVAAPAGGMG
ncbi:MAG TPA: hypothetical protein VGV92_01130 [Gammaproteobacteria bacterium]|nr:hypothetical protein [Gammaproteobacteria bacterium]